MQTLSDKLRERFTVERKGKKRVEIPRGAISRIAEFVGVYPQTVSRWLKDGHEPSIHVAPKVSELLRLKEFNFAAFRSGPKKSIIATN